MVSDNGSGFNKKTGGDSIIDNKDAKMAFYLEGEEKDLIEIEKMLSDGTPQKNKDIPSDKTKPMENSNFFSEEQSLERK